MSFSLPLKWSSFSFTKNINLAISSFEVNDSIVRKKLLQATKERKGKDLYLKGLGHAILGNFSTDRMVIELTKISK